MSTDFQQLRAASVSRHRDLVRLITLTPFRFLDAILDPDVRGHRPYVISLANAARSCQHQKSSPAAEDLELAHEHLLHICKVNTRPP